MIPNTLYQIVNEGLMKLLTLPLPYSAVALRTLRSMKMEMITPGMMHQCAQKPENGLSAVGCCKINTVDGVSLPLQGTLYQRKVVAEQNLRTQHYTLQEK